MTSKVNARADVEDVFNLTYHAVKLRYGCEYIFRGPLSRVNDELLVGDMLMVDRVSEEVRRSLDLEALGEYRGQGWRVWE